MSSLYYLAHNGLGDNLFSVGAIRFLINYYDNIYFLCKDIHYENVKLFFEDNKKINIIPFDSKNEQKVCREIIIDKYDKSDVFVLGCHKNYLTSKITNKYIIANIKDDGDYDLKITGIDYAEINNFIKSWYDDMKLGLKIFYEYFYLESTDESKKLYNSVNKYDNIIFIQNICSTGEKLSIDNLLKKYIHDKNSIIISTNENFYNNYKFIYNDKYDICQPFCMNKIIYYLDTILNSSEIYIIDGCFTGIILPLLKTNKLKSTKTEIIYRQYLHNNIF